MAVTKEVRPHTAVGAAGRTDVRIRSSSSDVRSGRVRSRTGPAEVTVLRRDGPVSSRDVVAAAPARPSSRPRPGCPSLPPALARRTLSKLMWLCGVLVAVTAVVLTLTVPSSPSGPMALSASSSGRQSLTAVSDTYVTAYHPNQSFGGVRTLAVDDAPKIAYVQFDMTGVPAGTTAANLVLT